MAIISLSSILFVLYSDMRIRDAIYEEAKIISMKKYDGKAYDISTVERNVLNSVGKIVSDSSFVDKARGGIDFTDSDISDDEVIAIIVHYNVRIPFIPSALLSYTFTEKIVMHTWVGYINGLHGFGGNNTTVYITDNGSVYHRSLNCSHIKLTITETNGNDVEYLRNEGGAKYKKCDICKSSLTDEILYVTSDGTKYHNTLACSGLIRNIRCIYLSEINGRRPCSRCGY